MFENDKPYEYQEGRRLSLWSYVGCDFRTCMVFDHSIVSTQIFWYKYCAYQVDTVHLSYMGRFIILVSNRLKLYTPEHIMKLNYNDTGLGYNLKIKLNTFFF